jgi:hypothetical protein
MKTIYWVIIAVILYIFCTKKKSKFGSEPEWKKKQFSRIRSKVESACKSIGGTYIEEPQSGYDYWDVRLGYCQKEINVKSSFGETKSQRNRRTEEEEEKIINAKTKQLSKIRPQLLSACQSTEYSKKFIPIKQNPHDPNKINLGFCDTKYIY